MFKLQKKPSALKRGHPTLQNMNSQIFFLLLWVIFAPLDPDPLTRLNPDPIRIQIRIRNPAFQQLTSATFLLSTSTQLPLLKYPLLFALQLKELTIGQMYHPLEDSFVAALLTWNPMAHLERFQLTKGMSGGIENKDVTFNFNLCSDLLLERA
jgi:hypothetical protein